LIIINIKVKDRILLNDYNSYIVIKKLLPHNPYFEELSTKNE